MPSEKRLSATSQCQSWAADSNTADKPRLTHSRPAGGLVCGGGVCKLGVRVHAQIMTRDLTFVAFGVAGFASIARDNEFATQLQAGYTHEWWCN
jgi:hypothetical protein